MRKNFRKKLFLESSQRSFTFFFTSITRFVVIVIKTFNCHETHKIWEGKVSLRLAKDIQQVARRKLRMLNNAKQLNDLRIPPNNRLEALKGNRAGEYSIRINQQWRICFKWQDNDAYDVSIEDYH